jgi:CBS domain-containing protein/gamma-glutamylcysteine synthetase
MGEKAVSTQVDEGQMRSFTKAVLNDLHALGKMLEDGMFEEGVRRIGAEQEIFLVDSAMRPAPCAMEILKAANDHRLTTELGLFNLEANLTPLDFSGDCLSKLETEINEVIGKVRETAKDFGADVVLCGILPTLQKSDYVAENLTPEPRYIEMNRVLTELHGNERTVHIKGLDELQLRLNDTYIEFSNTSYQVHLQVDTSDFVKYYNWSQVISAPVLASAVNSSILLGHRLWHESRLALFQHATDERSPAHQARSHPARVSFGDNWVKNSVLEIFHEDVARFRIILTRELEENAMDVLKSGKIPKLNAWRMHNGTVWRWNRPCFGIMDGKPSLRIEARYLPSGPTVADEIANSAFFLGLMIALPEEYGDVRDRMRFDDAKTNFFNIARNGMKTQIVWLDGKSKRASRLILEDLLPLARQGLNTMNIDSADIDRYLGIIEDRAKAEKTGAQWMIDSLANMDEHVKLSVRLKNLTSAMKFNQESGKTVDKWELAALPENNDWIDNYRTVEQFMATDLFTVRPEDVVDLAASLMNWRHIRHVPVEDSKGHLVGVVSHRDLLELLVTSKPENETVIRDVMKENPITVEPESSSLEALLLMREKNIGCLPVVKGGKLVGMITAHDFLEVSTKLLEERLLS